MVLLLRMSLRRWRRSFYKIYEESEMKDYINVTIEEDYIAVTLYVEHDEPMMLGEMMEKAEPNAYMNGENWNAFLNKYLEYNAPEILDVLDPDPEAGMYSAYINDVNEETKALAQKFAEIIEHLIEDEDAALDFLEAYADEIEWD